MPTDELMQPDFEILLYAELLLNIKSVSIIAQITGAPGEQLTAELTALGNKITLSCKERHSALIVPVDTTKSFTKQQTIAGDNVAAPLQARLPVTSVDALDAPDIEDDVPWSASSLNTNTSSFHCRYCEETVIASETIKQWKDLPSEGWAEMMDFWHCHKPPEPSVAGNGATSVSKGYAASSQIEAQPGVGLVDTTSFLVHAEDCRGVVTTNRTLTCATCTSALGIATSKPLNHRLHKHVLAVSPSSPSKTTTNTAHNPSKPYASPLEYWLSTHILATLARSNTRKLLFRPPDRLETTYLLWVLTPSLFIASSEYTSPSSSSSQPHIDNDTDNTTNSPKPVPATTNDPPDNTTETAHHALKLLHRTLPSSDVSAAEGNADTDTLEIPDALGRVLEERLKKPRKVPEGVGKLGAWGVTWVERFERGSG